MAGSVRGVWAKVAGVGLMAAACSSVQTVEPPRAVLRIGAATPVLQQGAFGISYFRSALSRETLVTIADDGRAQPRVLQSWQSSEDGLHWRFTIHEGIRFHDGTPVSAVDLAAQVDAQLKSTSLGAVKSVEAEGSNALRVTLNEPYAFLLEDLAVVSAQRTVDSQVFGTGPYEAVEQTADRLLMQAVAGHYRGDPEIERVEVQLFPDQRNAWSALMRDQVDMLYEVSRDSLEFVRGESGVKVATFPRPYVYLLGLNVKHPALAKTQVRRALDKAVDREELVRTAMAGQGEPAYGHVWPRHWTFISSANSIATNPADSVRLLEEAGYAVRKAEGRMPARLRLHCLVYEPLKPMGMVLQRQLAEIDVDLELEVVPTNQFLERITSGRFESFLFEMASARGMKWPYQFWHSSTPFLKHGYSGADAILDSMRRAANDDAFRAAAVAFQRRLHEDPPAVFLAWGRTSRAVSTRFEIPAGDEDIYHTIARWKLAPAAGK